jgi:acetylornithine/succinyldiaminopimelate/putrescine aminotransferase
VNAVNPTSLRLAPPLVVTEAEIDEAVVLVADVLTTAVAP